MNQWLQKHSQERPNAPAFYVGDKLITYGELADQASRRAHQLKAAGIGAGDRVGLLGANSADWIYALHALWWRGATAVPLHAQLRPAALANQIDGADLDLVVSNRPKDDLHDRITIAHRSFEDLQGASGPRAKPAKMRADAVATILFTSGSTGVPKAVPATIDNHRASAEASALRLGRRNHDRWLCALPLSHIGGLAIAIRSVIYGTSFDLIDSFQTATIADRLQQRPITLASFVPTMLRRLMRDHSGPFKTELRAVLIGGGPIDGDELRQARRRGLAVVSTYGMTEANSQLATLAPDAPATRLDTAGKPLQGVEFRVLDDRNKPVDTGTPGMIWARGPMICDGYLDAPTAAPPADRDTSLGDPWFCTGDIGRLDSDGYLTIHRRADDQIITGGENVDPLEVEAELRGVDGVKAVAVVGLDDSEWGQTVACAVVADADHYPISSQREQQIRDRLIQISRTRLAPFKWPRQWVFYSDLPRTASGKIDRLHLLQQLALTGDDKTCKEYSP